MVGGRGEGEGKVKEGESVERERLGGVLGERRGRMRRREEE